MVSSGPQSAPSEKSPGHNVIGVPPAMGILFTENGSTFDEKAIHSPSGEITEKMPPFEPGSIRGSNSSSRRSASVKPLGSLTAYTSFVPSRDSETKPVRSLNVVRGRVTAARGGAADRPVSDRPIATAMATAATTHGSALRHAGVARAAAAVVIVEAASGAPAINPSRTRLA